MKKYEVKYGIGEGSFGLVSVEIEAENFTVEGDGTLVFWISKADSYERVAAFAFGQWISAQEVK